jgi:hypothetical protein
MMITTEAYGMFHFTRSITILFHLEQKYREETMSSAAFSISLLDDTTGRYFMAPTPSLASNHEFL